jgi:VWFA-related protein
MHVFRGAVLAAAVVASAAQTPVFRTATQFVRVDAVVTDRHDVPVTNLTKDDFEIRENGVRQTIEDFSFVSIPVAHRAIDVDAPAGPPSDVASNGTSARASRAIVILVDDSSLSSMLHCGFGQDCPDVMIALKRALTRFLQSLSDNDQVALVWQSRSDLSTDFTNDIPRLIRSVNDRKAAMGLTPLGPEWRPRVDSLKMAVAALTGSTFARRAIVFVGLHACSAADITSWQGKECQDVYERARKADVPIYAIDPRVSPPPPPDHTMAELAINTGGLHFTLQSDPLKAVDKVVADNGSFYTFGFYPTPLVADGKVHDIEVVVKRPGLRVRSRQQYVADTANKPTVTANRAMTETLAAGLDNPGLPVRATAVPLGLAARNLTRTLVTLELTYPAAEAGDRAFKDSLRVGLLALTTDGKIKASFQRPIDLSGRWKADARGVFVINEAIDLPPGQLVLRAGITSDALGRSGTVHLPIDVPDFRDGDLTLSPLVVGVAGAPRDGVASTDAAMGLTDIRALVPFQPTVERTFPVTTALRLFLTGGYRSPATSATVTVTVSDETRPLRREMTIPATVTNLGSRRIQVDTSVPLAGLSPGAHVVSVTVSTGKKTSVSRSVPITVVR